MATPFTVYKLIVLYMLQNTENTLTNSQISEFILDREYTNYFHLQQAISELVEAELITMAVSYTHLDVYKRQQKDSSVCKKFQTGSVLYILS